ncbi:hypothetical protein X943_003777 [Babesia divergens]|uniref:RING-type domain-containing protein n=1 Tax=Babesia divergens TaxID=32595 RepID=A0AAD9LIG7_BABDI|nr:hypothetical protein X943_003777 [Babesia divergens]
MEASRRFNFFDKKLISVHSPGKGVVNFESVIDTAGSETFLWILESYGRINVLYRPLGADYDSNILHCQSFKGFEFEAMRIFYCHQAMSVIVVGKDEQLDHMLKFNTYKVSPRLLSEKPDEILQFIQSVPLFSPGHGLVLDQVESIVLSTCATVAAACTANGSIYVYLNYVLPPSEGAKTVQNGLRKFNVSDFESDRSIGTVRALHIRSMSDGSFGLAICCERAIVSIRLGSERTVLYRQLLESRYEVSCDLNKEDMFAVAQSDGLITVCNIESGMVFSFRNCGPCSSLCSYKGYIASASLESANALEKSYSTTLVMIRSVIVDMEFLAHSQYIPVVFKFDKAMGSLYVFARYGSNNTLILFELREKSIHERVQILIRKRLFDWAINMATAEQRPDAECEEIHKIHANWLYEKGHFDAAIESYCKAGPSVEPAFVIDRFMCLNSKVYLFNYLFHLHRCEMATSVHTVLLMRALQSLFKSHCYEKVTTSVDSDPVDCHGLLLKVLNDFGESHKDGIRDALYECRASGGSDFARVVALAQHNHDEYINILMEDFHDYSAALEYLKVVDPQVACNAILRHGRRLVKHDSGGVLALIRQIAASMPQAHGNAHDAFVPVFALEDKFLVEMLGLDCPNTPLLIYSTKLQLMLDQLTSCTSGSGAPSAVDGNLDHEVHENRLWKLLNGSTQLTEYQMIALILCLVYDYKRGANAMAIKMGYYHLPLVLAGIPDTHLDGSRFDLLRHALSYGYNEPTLWHIQNHKLLSFPSVVNILKNSASLKFGDVKDYLRDEFRRVDEVINGYETDIAQDKVDYGEMTRDLQRLQHSYFVINNTNCSRCDLSLEMPSLHFYCHHSFHTYCIGPDNVCPKCSPIAQEGGESSRKHESDDQDNFFKFLNGSTDPFDYMTQQIERFSLSSP